MIGRVGTVKSDRAIKVKPEPALDRVGTCRTSLRAVHGVGPAPIKIDRVKTYNGITTTLFP